MTYCDACGNQFSDVCGTCESLEGVPVKYRKKTHYDEVRAMSVEEMAEFIAKQHAECCGCEIITDCFEQNEGDCSKAWLEWLKSEALA